MTWILYFALLLVGAGVGGGVVGLLLTRNMPGPGVHTGPMLAVPERGHNLLSDRELAVLNAPAHPRYGKLLDTPAEGVVARRPDGVIRVGAHERGEHPYPYPRSVRADLPVQRAQTPDRQPWDTAAIPVVDEVEAMRQEYIAGRLREQEQAGGVITTDFMREVVALSREPRVYGETSVATLLAAERGLSFDCGNGLHAPVCDGRNCSCDCHRSAA